MSKDSESSRPGLSEILLVEDSQDDQVLTERALRNCNAAGSIAVAHDGAEALDYLFGLGIHAGRDTKVMPDLILLDLKLPKVDGLAVLETVRNDARTRNIPVVVLTSSDEERDLVDSYRLGADSYIRKTVDFSEFCDTIRLLKPQWVELSALRKRKAEDLR
jgi:two-component system, response regulator